jgi:hypothetical protein
MSAAISAMRVLPAQVHDIMGAIGTCFVEVCFQRCRWRVAGHSEQHVVDAACANGLVANPVPDRAAESDVVFVLTFQKSVGDEQQRLWRTAPVVPAKCFAGTRDGRFAKRFVALGFALQKPDFVIRVIGGANEVIAA